MKINSFFKLLNRKINTYDKLATNPFTDTRRMIIVWVEESGNSNPGCSTNNEVQQKQKHSE